MAELIAVLIFALVFYGSAILYLKFGWFKRFYHDIMGWHKPTDEKEFDGCSLHSKCKYCGKEIMQDSQGNRSIYHSITFRCGLYVCSFKGCIRRR